MEHWQGLVPTTCHSARESAASKNLNHCFLLPCADSGGLDCSSFPVGASLEFIQSWTSAIRIQQKLGKYGQECVKVGGEERLIDFIVGGRTVFLKLNFRHVALAVSCSLAVITGHVVV